MAEKDDLRTIAGKALADPDFRQKLLDDPEAAAAEAGFELSAEQMKTLKDMDKEQLQAGFADLDERLTMGCWGKGYNPCTWD
ncbi:MAG: Franean1_4349 family RiPP [Anaerolineales bacterium]|nr:Franean1_4349 family RiPP [Anaerolineales bacterium]